MDYRQTLLVLLTALLCGSQVLTATPTEALKKASVKERQFVLFADDGKTWQEAYDDCIKRNMSLASIESEEENNKVASLIKNSDRGSFFWLSGTDLGHTGRWVWKSTGRDVTYNQWLQGRPEHNVRRNGEVDHCMSVYSGLMRWYDFACSSLQNYICQHWV